jgi:hypothetical protein
MNLIAEMISLICSKIRLASCWFLAKPQFGQASLAEYQRFKMTLIAEMISLIYSKIRLASLGFGQALSLS